LGNVSRVTNSETARREAMSRGIPVSGDEQMTYLSILTTAPRLGAPFIA